MVLFFGVPVATNMATSRLAKPDERCRARRISWQRLPGTAGYRVTIGPPFDDFPSPTTPWPTRCASTT